MSNLSVFAGEFDGTTIRVTEDGRFSVFDVLVAFGVADKKQNAQVVHNRVVASNPEVSTFCSNFKFPGRGQRETPVANEEGIYQILMLCPGKRGAEFRGWAAKIVRERREEESNPELAYSRGRQRAIATWKKQGKTDKEIQTRLRGIEVRYQFTDTLKEHGVVQPWQYAIITNAIYKEIFGQTAAEMKESLGLSKRDALRDNLSLSQMAANLLAEALSTEDIESNDRQGFQECHKATQDAASRVKRVFE